MVRIKDLPVSVLGVVSLLAASLTGCRADTMEPASEPVVINFAYYSPDSEYYGALLAEFNRSFPDIKVELQGIRQRDRQLDLQTVDVFVGTQYDVAALQEQGDILNLAPFVENDLTFAPSDFPSGVLEAFKDADGVWAIPYSVDPLVMYYNKDLFDQAGVQYPQRGWVWEDFLGAALAIGNPGANVFGYVSTPQSIDPLPFIYQHGGGILDDLQKPTRTTFDDPLTIEAVEWYADLVFKYNVAPTPLQKSAAFSGNRGVMGGILQNRAGMWAGLLSERGGSGWGRGWDMAWGVVALPRDVQSMTLINAEGYFISSHTQDREACWRWVSFLSEQPSKRVVPARKSLLASEAYEQEAGSDVAAAARDSLVNAVMMSPRQVVFNEILTEVFSPAIEDVLEERVTPEEAMVIAQRRAENVLGP